VNSGFNVIDASLHSFLTVSLDEVTVMQYVHRS
jgi:hypothetical protein